MIRYRFPDNIDTKITEYFSVDAVSGLVTLKKSLMLDPDLSKTYGVSNIILLLP